MNRAETIQIITILAGNYDSVLNKTKQQKEVMINTWQECLGDLDYELVLAGVKKTIIESQYPPTIHEVRKNAIELIKPSTTRTAVEAWDEAYKMICNGLYMTEEQFETHSPEVKKFFGSVKQVKELAQCDAQTTNTVTKGQFLKQYEVITNREKQEKLLPANMQEVVSKLAEKMSVQTLSEAKEK